MEAQNVECGDLSPLFNALTCQRCGRMIVVGDERAATSRPF